MKTTILALGFAVMAATAGSTGASAFSSPPAAHESTGGALTPVTFWGGHYSDYGYGSYHWRRPHYRWYNGYYGHNRYWDGYRRYSYYRPYGWRHYQYGW